MLSSSCANVDEDKVVLLVIDNSLQEVLCHFHMDDVDKYISFGR